MSLPSQGEQPRNPAALERLPRLVGMDLVLAGQPLEAIRANEAALVEAWLPAGSIDASPVDRSESLVVLPAALNLTRQGGGSIYVQQHDGKIYHGSPRGNADWHGNFPHYSYQEVDQDPKYARGSAISVEPTAPWAFSREELPAAIERAAVLTALKEQFVREHPLGEGALLVTNRYGGIDPTDPEATTRSILARFIYADKLEIPDRLRENGDPGPFVDHGLLDPRIEALVGKDWLTLRATIKPSLAIIEQLQTNNLDITPVMQSLHELLGIHVGTFLDKWGPSLMLSAQMLRNPEATNRTLNALLEADNSFRGGMRSSIENHRLR